MVTSRQIDKEVLSSERKAPLLGLTQQNRLAYGGDKPAGPTPGLRVGPAPDAGLVAPDDLSDDFRAAEDLYNGVGWFEHERILCANRKMSNGIIKRKTRKTAAPRSAHSVGMVDLSEITPEWVKARMKAKRLKQAAIAELLDITQDKVSKSLNHKREFTTRELEILARSLRDPSPAGSPAHDPETAELLARIANLPQSQKDAVRALLTVLEQIAPSPAETPEESDEPRR